MSVGAWAALLGAWATVGLVEAPGVGLVDTAAAAALGLEGDAAEEGRFSMGDILHGQLRLQHSEGISSAPCNVSLYRTRHTGEVVAG